jgi:hypothetical protein
VEGHDAVKQVKRDAYEEAGGKDGPQALPQGLSELLLERGAIGERQGNMLPEAFQDVHNKPRAGRQKSYTCNGWQALASPCNLARTGHPRNSVGLETAIDSTA